MRKLQFSTFLATLAVFGVYSASKASVNRIFSSKNEPELSPQSKKILEPIDPVEFYTVLIVIAVLVLIGGIFAGNLL